MRSSGWMLPNAGTDASRRSRMGNRGSPAASECRAFPEWERSNGIAVRLAGRGAGSHRLLTLIRRSPRSNLEQVRGEILVSAVGQDRDDRPAFDLGREDPRCPQCRAAAHPRKDSLLSGDPPCELECIF